MIQEFLLSGSIGPTFLVAIVTGLVVYWLIQKWKYKYPPGPTAFPLIGNMMQVDLKTLHEQAFEWSKKYGPVVSIRLGPMPLVFVNTIDTALEVLVKKSTDFASRRRSPSIEMFTYGGKDIAFSNYGPIWKLHRKIASKALRQYLQGDALEHRIFDAVETAFVEIDKISGQFDPEQYINFIVTNILTSLCFGGKYDFKDKEVSYILKADDDINDKFGRGILEDFVPGLKYVYKTQAFKELEVFTNEVIEGFIRRKYKEAESTFNKAGYRIPKGTNIAINHWALHHDPSAWDDVDRFIPERYLGEDGKLGPKPKNWLPFSAGTRVCLGESVAKPKLHLIFASLMQRYKWKMESGLCADIVPVGSAFILGCKPYKVIAERRI